MMDRSLIAVEKLQEETESTCYSAHFHTDNLKPSKKGNRENIQLVLKVELFICQLTIPRLSSVVAHVAQLLFYKTSNENVANNNR